MRPDISEAIDSKVLPEMSTEMSCHIMDWVGTNLSPETTPEETVTRYAPFGPVSLKLRPWMFPGYTTYGRSDRIWRLCMCPRAQ